MDSLCASMILKGDWEFLKNAYDFISSCLFKQKNKHGQGQRCMQKQVKQGNESFSSLYTPVPSSFNTQCAP